MKTFHSNHISRFYFGSIILLTITVIAAVGIFRASASNEANESSTKDGNVSVQLKTQNNHAVNLRPGRDLATNYDSGDLSSYQMKAGQNSPLALASADFDVDGFPDLATGYSTASGGVLTFHKGNAEAFAPQSEESFALIKEGRFPDPFIAKAESFAIAAAPDFLAAGDFDRDGNLDVMTATRGGDRLFLFSGKGTNGGFDAAREIKLAGRVTALTAGEIDASDNRADLLVGVEDNSGAALLVFENAESGVFASPVKYQLSSSAVSLELGKLDDDAWADAAILTSYGVFVLHGFDQKKSGKAATGGAARMEQISLPFVPTALAIGQFVWDRAGKTELALLAPDGTVQIARRGLLDERPYSIEESRLNRRENLENHLRGGSSEKLKDWQIGESENWTVSESIYVGASANRGNSAAPVLMRANLSGQNTDDVLFLDSQNREVKILYTNEPAKVNGEVASFAGRRTVYAMETANQPTAMLSMPLNIFVRPGLVILQNGKSAPSFVPSAPTATFTVDRADDVAAANGCTAAANDCSLRGAITRANLTGGADVVSVPAGTYTLTIANPGAPGTNNNEDNNATGDLDILDSITITGAGQGSTIIQAGTNTSNGIDKVFASNPICTSTVNTSISGLTARFGRNMQPFNAPDFSFTGGGLDWCNTGSNGMLTVTNATFDQNTVVNGFGGGINLSPDPGITSGQVTLTGATLSNNATVANLSARGGGLSSDGGPYSITITGSTISGNTTPGIGGGIYINHNVIGSNSDVFQLSGVTISGNQAGSAGGGVYYQGNSNQSFTLNQSSTLSGNISGTVASEAARGGGIFIVNFGSNAATITKTTITGNMLSATSTDNRGGAGIFAGSGPINISFSRIVGNTGTTAALGTGLRKDTNPGTTDARNNWWGCNTGPSAPPCDTATIAGGSSGTLLTDPWLRFTHTASPSTIVVGQTSTLTASFLTNSNNQAIAVSNLDVLLGLPITFNNAVRGTISGAQPTIQSNGTATATFTGTSVGAGSANAAVDNGTATANITIGMANTTTTITSDNPDPSVVGQTITVNYTVAPQFGGTPTGTVTVSDGVNSCMGTVAAGSCNVALTTVGARTLTATYAGDASFNGSFGTTAHQVNQASTTTTITAESADPTAQGEVFTVFYTVSVSAPGTGTPTGTVTVSDGVNSCMGTVAAGQCPLALNTAGMRTLTATYSGNTNFAGSVSPGEPHTVLPVTAAPVEVSGRVVTSLGRGISRASVIITDSSGNRRLATTSAFGYFRFADVQAGETYIISIKAKRYRFAPQVISLTGDLTDLNFIAQE